MLPSVVRLDPDGQPDTVGDDARRHAVEHPENTIYSVKRLMGRSLADIDAAELAMLAYDVVQGEHDTARVRIGDRVHSPQEISALILQRLKAVAEHALGVPVRRAVVTVPAYFDDAQRQATRDAGRLAGLEVLRIVNEPTAAALAYGIGADTPESTHRKPGHQDDEHQTPRVSLNTKFNPEACASSPTTSPSTEPTDDPSDRPSNTAHPNSPTEHPTPPQTVAVYDLGGGTFDISILRVLHTERGAIDRVLATAGDTHLGGDDVDQMIVELIQREVREQFADRFSNDIAFPPATRQAFRNLAEAAKIRLSTEDAAHIEVQLPAPGGQAAAPLTYRRTLTRDEFRAMIAPWVERTLAACRDCLKAAKLTPADVDRVVMVGGSTRIPAVRDAVGQLFETDPYTALNPDEVVALGAAVQASILAGTNTDRLLLDVIPLSLGIETMGGAVAKLITANTTIPARATEQFTTYADNQTAVQINVYQGERELVQDCRLIGRFELKGVPPMPAGLAKVEVTFLVDANGVLTVEAVEKRSEMRARTQVVPHHGLSRDEVDRLERESFTHARKDMTAHRVIDLRNQARLSLRAIEKQLDKVGDRLDDAYRAQVRAKADAVRAHLNDPRSPRDFDDATVNAFHATLDDMEQASRRLAEVAITATLQAAQTAPDV